MGVLAPGYAHASPSAQPPSTPALLPHMSEEPTNLINFLAIIGDSKHFFFLSFLNLKIHPKGGGSSPNVFCCTTGASHIQSAGPWHCTSYSKLFYRPPWLYIRIKQMCSQIEEVDKNMKYWQNQSLLTIWCSNNAISEDTEEIVEILSTASFSCADPLFAFKIKLFKALK